MNDLTLAAGARAFGDGSHPTTQGVMAALQVIDPNEFAPGAACDMGCGSGILTLAIIEKFGCPVIAVDVVAESVATTRANAAQNGCSEHVTALQADGFNHPEITARGPYELIVMNILAEPLMKLAVPAVRHLATHGVLILSGMLVWQEAKIRQVYEGLGLELSFRAQLADWVTLVFQKP